MGELSFKHSFYVASKNKELPPAGVITAGFVQTANYGRLLEWGVAGENTKRQRREGASMALCEMGRPTADERKMKTLV